MFLYGNQIINDYNIDDLLRHLVSIKALRGRDYIYYCDNKIILKPTEKIKNYPYFWEHKICTINSVIPTIGRRKDSSNRIIYDYIFRKRSNINNPYTSNWSFDLNYTSVIDSIMNLIELIPKEGRKDVKYVITFLCSRIDSCNDPINGIIEGRWKSTFTGGIHPTGWKNSSQVFRERIAQNSPVKYGQCWVLADILTGIYSFLGLTAKSIRINDPIMDLYDTGGIDIFKSTKDLILKSEGERFNPLDMILEEDLTYESKLDIKTVDVNKGPIFSLEEAEAEAEASDLYNINYFIEEKENKSWNFHVWTEVLIGNEWYILDPSPIHDIQCKFRPYSEKRPGIDYNSCKFFGPISVSSLKRNEPPKDLLFNFKYLFACINGQNRYWSPLMTEGQVIMYLNQVKFEEPRVLERNKQGSLIDITKDYQSGYELFHKYHPMYLKIRDNNFMNIYIHVRSKFLSNYVIQFALFYHNTPLYIHRERMSTLSAENMSFLKSPSIKKYRLKATKLTFCVYDIRNNLFWNQCIQI